MSSQKRGCRIKLPLITALALLIVLSAVNVQIVGDPLTALTRHELTFEEFVDTVESRYSSDNFAGKSGFVNVNGLFARLTGRRVLNKVVRGTNGMLTGIVSDVDVTELAASIEGFAKYLEEYEDIPFLYVQLPYKSDLDGNFYPEGVTACANQNTDHLLSCLNAAGVNALDMRPQLSQTSEMIQQYFYKTDHHWNPEGAFVAFREIMAELQIQFPEGNIDMEYAQWEMWERHEKEDWFLGSWGKRVGQFFGGTDPLIWYTPQFETSMSCSIPKHGELHCGDFSAANIRTQYIEQRDLFGYNPYCVYIGGDYPLVQHRNLEAPSELRLLILKDSFTLPLQSYFSTVFQEVDVIDPRYFTECSIAEYAEWTRPDIVLFMINLSSLGEDKYKKLGTEQAIANHAREEAPIVSEQGDIVLASDSSNNYRYATIPLEADSVYRVTFDCVDVVEGSPDGVALTLYNRTKEERTSNRLFDLNYYQVMDGYEWTFRTPKTEDTLQLLFYAGIYGSTAGNGLIYRNVILEKM